MMMKKLGVGLLTACLASAAWAQENALKYNIVELNESASVTVPNDTMHITLHIQSEHKNRQTANQQVTQKLNALQTLIRKHKNITSELGSRQTYPQYNDKNQIVAWQDSVSVRLKSQHFNDLSVLAAEAESLAMLRGVHFSVSPEKRAQATEAASTQALQSVQKRAQWLSQQLGFSGYQWVKLSLNESFDNAAEYASPMASSVSMMRQSAPKVASDSMNIAPNEVGEQIIRQSISASIQMK